MKHIVTIILIFLFLFVSFFFYKRDTSNKYKILKIKSCTEIYVDFNKDQVCDENELVTISYQNFDSNMYDKIDKAILDYLSFNFAKEKLLNKYIKIQKTDGGYSIILPDGTDYKKLLEKEGYIITSKNHKDVDKKISYGKSLDLVSLNTKTNIVHELNCKLAFSSPFAVLIKRSDLQIGYKKCKICSEENDNVKFQNKNRYFRFPRIMYEKYEPIYKDDYLEFYVTDFTKYYYPSSKCYTTPCISLLNEINKAKYSIDFAIYGVDLMPDITKALLRAKDRGVKIRWVYDLDKKNNTIYPEILTLKKVLLDNRADTQLSESQLNIRDSIMHNKFFIFDDKKVFTGSANLSHTDLSGFNANSAILISSSDISKLFKDEFEQMYKGFFHKAKSPTQVNMTNLGNSEISVYFSPQDTVISNHIIPLVDSAKKYVYVPVFVVTHKDFVSALIAATKRGVDVRLIVDSTSASNRYSSTKQLRENGVKVKTENLAGKMHMKSLIIDDEYVVIGSMNFSKSGESYNDENVLIIKNTSLSKSFKYKFLHFWNSIPNKWSSKNPSSESLNSINSCFDGIDNDFDGKIDSNDEGCKYAYKK